MLSILHQQLLGPTRPHLQTRQLTTFDPAKRSKTVAVPHGERVVIGEAEGCGFITSLWLTFPGWFWQHWNPEAPISAAILKTLILRIYWDGAPLPAVEAPVGDFFGLGLCETANFTTAYLGMSSGGFFCKFLMPFARGFRIEIENLGDASPSDASPSDASRSEASLREGIDTQVFLNALYQSVESPGPAPAYFHAQFHTARRAGPEPALIAELHGQGAYVGCSLSMQGQDRNYLSFLEAPEYAYVDDDWETPRFTGTGLEDYFLGGWYFRDGPFIGPLHGVPVKDTLNSTVAMLRIHDADAVHFRSRFRMAFANPWSPERLRPYAYSSVAYAYLAEPTGQGPGLPSRHDLLCWYRVRDRDHQSIP